MVNTRMETRVKKLEKDVAVLETYKSNYYTPVISHTQTSNSV